MAIGKVRRQVTSVGHIGDYRWSINRHFRKTEKGRHSLSINTPLSFEIPESVTNIFNVSPRKRHAHIHPNLKACFFYGKENDLILFIKYLQATYKF